MTYANHRDEDQPVHLRSLIGNIDFRHQESMVKVASFVATISTDYLLYVAGQTSWTFGVLKYSVCEYKSTCDYKVE